MPPLTSDEIEAKIKAYEERVRFSLSAHNKATMRDIVRTEHRFEERREAKEEEGHSNSAVGDLFNVGNRE